MLNRNPRNYFAEVEQIAFSPAHMVPGIEPSPDKMLQVASFTDDSMFCDKKRRAWYQRSHEECHDGIKQCSQKVTLKH